MSNNSYRTILTFVLSAVEERKEADLRLFLKCREVVEDITMDEVMGMLDQKYHQVAPALEKSRVVNKYNVFCHQEKIRSLDASNDAAPAVSLTSQYLSEKYREQTDEQIKELDYTVQTMERSNHLEITGKSKPTKAGARKILMNYLVTLNTSYGIEFAGVLGEDKHWEVISIGSNLLGMNLRKWKKEVINYVHPKAVPKDDQCGTLLAKVPWKDMVKSEDLEAILGREALLESAVDTSKRIVVSNWPLASFELTKVVLRGNLKLVEEIFPRLQFRMTSQIDESSDMELEQQ
ncbi:hypothetical protein INT47_012135 [Mucor saturninus]|uniref:Uncharacterized protein n=1 Tax=Mucor saturninus TaxID=64648 RepID=A0A8H7QIH4_9FUNG|nr:hypothetical protein INT47_012135 [Mucor saturninus]